VDCRNLADPLDRQLAVPPHVSENTHVGYRVEVEKHLIPGIGAHRLERLTPEYAERLYAKMQRAGLAAGTAHHVHRTLRNALNEAVRRGHLGRNPVLLAKAPKLTDEEIEPHGLDEIQRLLKAATERRNGARWVVALALGLRQGEALGLKWPDVDLDKGTMRIRRGRLRPKYTHGCAGTCGRKPGYCPQKEQTRPDTGDTKSRAGKRMIGLPGPLIALFRAHKQKLDAERETARQLVSSGTKKDGHSPGRTAARSIQIPIIISRKRSLRKRDYGMLGCMMPGMRRQPYCLSWECLHPPS
jgi:integrase